MKNLKLFSILVAMLFSFFAGAHTGDDDLIVNKYNLSIGRHK